VVFNGLAGTNTAVLEVERESGVASDVPGGSRGSAPRDSPDEPTLKGGIKDNGEESQGREEEGRQEALSRPRPSNKKGGGCRPLFNSQLLHIRCSAASSEPSAVSASSLLFLSVPDSHVPDDVPLLQLIDDVHAGDDAAEGGVARIEVRLR
jgi:hypothetical protein